MVKSVFKELGIVILLLLAVGLILAIIFYEYIPNNKTVPVKIQAYDMPEDIKEELQNAGVQEENIVKTYFIDSTVLDAYESTNDYDKGKPNPFADYSSENRESANSNNSSNNNAGNNNNSNNNNNNNKNGIDENEQYITTPGKNY